MAPVNLGAVDIVYLHFSEAFTTAAQKMFTEKLKYGLDEWQ